MMAGHAFVWENSLRASARPANVDCSKPPFIAACSFPAPSSPLAQKAQGTWLAQACGLAAKESFNEDDIYSAMDQLIGHWVGLEKQLYQRAFPQAVRLVLYDLTSVYFEGKGPEHLAR